MVTMARPPGESLALDKLWSEARGMDDAQVRKAIWKGAIPLRVVLDANEVTTLTPPPPYYVMAPRMSFLPLLVDKLRRHFQSVLPPGTEMAWFDYNGLPLKWNILTGVLFDLLTDGQERPWQITVHFRNFPSDLLIPWDGEETIKWSFMNALKEGIYIAFGNTKPIMQLSQQHQADLWLSIASANGANYEEISSRFRPFPLGTARGVPSAAGSGHPLSPTVKLNQSASGSPRGGGGGVGGRGCRVPVRLYIRTYGRKGGGGDGGGRGGGNAEVEDDLGCISQWEEVVYATRPVEIPTEKGQEYTLGDALRRFVPQLFEPADEQSGNSVTVRSARDGFAADSPRRRSSETEERDTGEEHPSKIVSKEAVANEEDGRAFPSIGDEDVPSGGQDSGTTSQQEGERGDAGDNVTPTPAAIAAQMGEPSTAGDRKAKVVNGTVRIQGLDVGIDLPLEWLSRIFCGPDQILHVCIFLRRKL